MVHFGLESTHIDHNGGIESQQQLEQRLVELHGLQHDLFMDEVEKVEQAYTLQHDKYAYINEGLKTKE